MPSSDLYFLLLAQPLAANYVFNIYRIKHD
jgi:hypothetical protein